RWCPGCGDYSILAQVQRTLPAICQELDIPRENIVFVSGIGCSSRFPYYMNTYGFHTIHGRAPTIATGLKAMRPDLQVWIATGDGDALSIGTNHLVHCLRRNVDVKILLFNNRIYGLTKGQYSPTSEQGKKTKSSPMGSLEPPLHPLHLALTSGATFVARVIATDAKHMQEVLQRAARHRGSAFIEIYQNCNVFNDEAFEHFTDKKVRDEQTLYLVDGEPLVYGANRDKTLAIRGGSNGMTVEKAALDDVPEEQRLVLHETAEPNLLARMLSQLNEHEFPVPLGVFRCVEQPLYGEMMTGQVSVAQEARGKGDFMAHLHSGDTWTVSSS
ncbi:MAG: 2-oxoacid:ferredoxin oxidoreductase subunit beta, partial [Thiogranum sp.]